MRLTAPQAPRLFSCPLGPACFAWLPPASCGAPCDQGKAKKVRRFGAAAQSLGWIYTEFGTENVTGEQLRTESRGRRSKLSRRGGQTGASGRQQPRGGRHSESSQPPQHAAHVFWHAFFTYSASSGDVHNCHLVHMAAKKSAGTPSDCSAPAPDAPHAAHLSSIPG